VLGELADRFLKFWRKREKPGERDRLRDVAGHWCKPAFHEPEGQFVRIIQAIMRTTLLACSLVCCVAVLAGCESDSSSGDIRSRQDAALNDPFGYGPDANDVIKNAPSSPDRTDVTGGGMGHFDKDAMKRDLDAVFNP
jgi:hypothetical protein